MKVSLFSLVVAAMAQQQMPLDAHGSLIHDDTEPYADVGGTDFVRQAWRIAYDDTTTINSVNMMEKVRSAEFGLNPGRFPTPATRIRKSKHEIHHQSPEYPNHELRITDPSSLGVDPGVLQYSGYLDVLDDDKHFFFWLFESRSDPKNDPVILWLNGGPGCSSSTGEFFELGPSFIGPNGTLNRNEHSWNNKATVIFLDQPVNVGYSYSSKRVANSYAAGEDVYMFLELLFDAFPQYNNGKFHVTGESYAGHYLPAIGKAILDHPERNFNLSSMALGNPITDPRYQAEAEVAMLCGEGGFPPLLSHEECTELYRMVPRCESLIQSCYDSETTVACVGAALYCSRLSDGFEDLGRSPYDLSLKCTEENPCYPETQWIDEFLNRDDVKEAVGADVDVFVGCSNQVGLDFFFTGDGERNFAPELSYILDSGVPVLQMSGKLDWICNILGSRRFLPKLQWNGAFEFNSKYMKPWYHDGEIVGWSKSAKGLTYLEVEGAGHMIPHDQPKVAAAFINQWIEGNHKFHN